MFTGLIEYIGTVKATECLPEGLRLFLGRPSSFGDIKTGDSISVNGACLTIASLDKGAMAFEVMQESLEHTNIGDLKQGDKVNLERALKTGDRLGGHFVAGHIDFKAQIKNIRIEKETGILEIILPKEHDKYIVSKGSVSVDGVSLTVGEVRSDIFVIHLIPYTLKNTTLGLRKRGDFVNIEIDLLAKLAFKSKEQEQQAPKVDMGFLREHGFM